MKVRDDSEYNLPVVEEHSMVPTTHFYNHYYQLEQKVVSYEVQNAVCEQQDGCIPRALLRARLPTSVVLA